MVTRLFITYLFVCISLFASAQITLDNASFEGTPQDATMPQGWFGCEMGTTPDILPGVWGVINEPSDGDTYIGLITRSDGSFESISQRLSEPLVADLCYDFTIDLARSKTYAGFNFPIRLRIYGANRKCKKKQLLWASPTISHEDWKTYKVQFTADKNFHYIIIEAYYGEGLLFDYNGNILIDAISPLKACIRA